MKCKKCNGTGQIASPAEIKKRRVDSGIRQCKIAAEMGVSRTILSGMEHGHRQWNAMLEKKFLAAIRKLKTKNL